VSAATERARVAVTVALKRAQRALDEQLPELAEHVENSVKTGMYCRYAPDPSARLRIVIQAV
jgi:hypothetical protein